MEKQQKEITVFTNGVPDLALLPKDILDMIVAALELNIEKAPKESEFTATALGRSETGTA